MLTCSISCCLHDIFYQSGKQYSMNNIQMASSKASLSATDKYLGEKWQIGFVTRKCLLSYDVASGREIMPCNKICKPLVVYRFTGNVMTSITTLRT